jgi:hypothetical protein
MIILQQELFPLTIQATTPHQEHTITDHLYEFIK